MITSDRPYKPEDKKAAERNKLWQAWHNYNHLKLCAALDGDIDADRDLDAQKAYSASDRPALDSINADLLHYERELTYAEGQKAADLLTAIKPRKVRKPRPKPTLAEIRKMAKRGGTIGVKVDDDTVVTLTSENYKRDLEGLADERRSQIEDDEAYWTEFWKCKCAVHQEGN